MINEVINELKKFRSGKKNTERIEISIPALDRIIFALEQVSVLDKIRAEIDSHCSDNRDRNDGLYIAMKIIDKYRTESEDKG